MPDNKTILIVGGGPAGALAAAELARNGRSVLLFDEKLAWEKPCGGGLTDKAIARWPFLREAPVERNWIDRCELISATGRKVSFRLDQQIAIFSRLHLNGLLLDRARDAGAQIIRERILEISGGPGAWKLRSSGGEYEGDFVVLASGARNSFHKQFRPTLGPENFVVAVGYYIPAAGQTVRVKFVKDLHGYIWIFPRTDHFSAGICGRMQGKSTAELRQILETYLSDIELSIQNAQFYAHIIPSLSMDTLRKMKFAGEGWAMIGDAAGFVDAITGEGLYYALRSAELCAQSLLNDAAEKYPAMVQSDFLFELELASRIANRFYSGEWMGGNVIERMLQLTARSSTFRDLMRDLFAGSQEYANLKQRVYCSLPRIAAEALMSGLWKGRQDLAVPGDQVNSDLLKV